MARCQRRRLPPQPSATPAGVAQHWLLLSDGLPGGWRWLCSRRQPSQAASAQPAQAAGTARSRQKEGGSRSSAATGARAPGRPRGCGGEMRAAGAGRE